MQAQRVLPLLFFLSVCFAQHPFADKLFRTKEINKPLYIGDPVGLLFSKLHEAIANRGNDSTPWFPDFHNGNLENKYATFVDRALITAEQETQQPKTRNSIPFEGEILEAREHPEKDKYKYARKANNFQQQSSITTRDVNNTVTHVPFNAPPVEEECSGRGKLFGNITNICRRRDCFVNVLRCLPDLDVIVDSMNYTSVDLSLCRVEELQCFDNVIHFKHWEDVKIYQLLCGNEIRRAEDGDLDHCSVLSILDGHKLWNYTYAPDDDPKCWVDEIHCPHYCDSISVECNGEPVTCDFPLECMDDKIACEQEYVLCNGEPISCDDESLKCMDHYPNCDSYYVSCNGQNPCAVEVNGILIDYDMECNSDGLVTCNGTLATCDGHVLACADDERTICHDDVKRLLSYTPTILCTDNLSNCTDIIVNCNSQRMYCDEGSTWVYNATFSEYPFCVSDELRNDEYWFSAWYEEFEDQFSSLSSDTTEYDLPHPSVKFAREMCRIGVISYKCSIENCQNRTFQCKNSEIECDYDKTEITGTYPNYTASCDGKAILCITEPECPIVQRPCKQYESCQSLVYQCSDTDRNNCGYDTYDCQDGCWAKEGEWECICPLDYTGKNCQHYRDYLCDITLVDPLPNCLEFEDPQLNLIETEPVCFLYSVYDIIRFTYQINCYFTDLTDIEKSNDPRTSFSYFVRNGNEFARSSSEPQPQILMKVFDFNRLSDNSASILLGLTQEQFGNGDFFYFDLNLASLYDSTKKRARYFSTGRFYFEVDIFTERYGDIPPGMQKRQSDRRFLDFTDYEKEKAEITFEGLDGFVLFLYLHLADPTMIIAVFIAAMAIYYFVKYHQRYVLHKELSDPKQFKQE